MTTTTDFRCAVRADLFLRALSGVSDEDTRYYLNGVFVQPCGDGGAIMTATNGHWLISVQDPRGIVTGSGIVKLDKAAQAALKKRPTDIASKFGRATERVLVVERAEEFKDSRALIVLNGLPSGKSGETFTDHREEAFEQLSAPTRLTAHAMYGECLIDGTFPDYTKVIPESVDWDKPVPPIDQRLVDKASKALCEDEKRRPVRMGGNGDGSPVVVVAANRQLPGWSAIAVVMPIRVDSAINVPTFWKKSA